MNNNGIADGPQFLPLDPTFGTKAIHSGYVPKDWNFAPVVPPLVLSTTFEQDGPAQHRVWQAHLFDTSQIYGWLYFYFII